MSVQTLIDTLTKVRKTGRDSWIACCPAHADKSPSMTLRELEDGRVLVHCFAGCSVEEILSASNLTFDALFPPKPIDSQKPLRRPFPAADVIEALAHETSVVALAAIDARNGRPVDVDRLLLAAERIQRGRELANG